MMRRAWPADADQDLLRRVVVRCSGPSDGDWSESTQNDLFGPVASEGNLDANMVARLWSGMVCDRIETTARKKYQFLNRVDAELTVVAAKALGDVPQEVGSVVERLLPVIKKAKRAVTRPFARSGDWDTWSKNLRALLWCDGFLKLISMCQRAAIVELDSALDVVDLHTGGRCSWEVVGVPDPTGLDEFWKRVDKAWVDTTARDRCTQREGCMPSDGTRE